MDATTITVIVVLSIAVSFLLPRFLLPIFTGQARAKKIIASGVSARAVITNLEQTGTLINNQPRCHIHLRVEPKDQPPFTARVTQVILLTQIPQFQPGAVVTVRYDPSDRTKVAIQAFGHVAIDEAEATAMIAKSERLLTALNDLNGPGAGKAASAIVTAFKPTGVTVNGQNPLAVVEVKVLPSGGTPFDAAITGVFGAEGLHKYQPGKTVEVRYDPADPSRVSFDTQKTVVERVD